MTISIAHPSEQEEQINDLMANLDTYRSQAEEVTMEQPLQNSARDLWPFVSDPDRIERKAGLQATSKTEFSHGAYGSLVRSEVKLSGITMRYYELPFEWQKEKYTALERVFLNGPMKYVKGSAILEDGPNGAVLKMVMRYVPRYSFIPVGLMLKTLLPKLLNVVASADRDLVRQKADSGHSIQGHMNQFGFESPSTDNSQEESINRLAQDWARYSDNDQISKTVSRFVLSQPNNFVKKMRPFEIAHAYGLPKLDTLRFFLKATRDGQMNMSWDVLCPSCQGAAERTESLNRLDTEAHCETCNIDYTANFDQNVEVTFRPTAGVRECDDSVFCVASPFNFSHIHSQFTISSGEERRVELELAPGYYSLRGANPSESVRLLIEDTQDSEATEFIIDAGTVWKQLAESENNLQDVSEVLGGHPLIDGKLISGPKVVLNMSHSGKGVQSVKVEYLKLHNFAATAHLVTTLQDFRELFSSEVLRPGLQLGVSNIYVMFTDLKDSTRMYDEQGDAKAFALVQEHFAALSGQVARNNGAIVKTIGDAVMAVFIDHKDAVRAGLDILETFAKEESNPGTDHELPLIVKVGLHGGPSIALNLNEKLDYFGSTVNKAARIEGQASGGDMVLSEDVFRQVLKDPEFKYEFKDRTEQMRISSFSAELKGISQSGKLYRVRPQAGTNSVALLESLKPSA